MVNQFILDHFGVGGSGFAGCASSPFVGGPGGDAGTVYGQALQVCAVTTNWKSLTAPGKVADLTFTNPGNISCSGGVGGGGVNKAIGGKHGMTLAGVTLGADGAIGSACPGVGGCNGGVIASSYTAVTLDFYPLALNTQGHVVGYNGSSGKAIFWDGVMDTPINSGYAQAINDSDMVVGYDQIITQESPPYHAFFWSPTTGKQSLQEPAGATLSSAISINSSGEIIGGASSPNWGNSVSGFVYWANRNAAPVFLQDTSKHAAGAPIAISDSGVIISANARWANYKAAPQLFAPLVTPPPYINYSLQITCVDAVGNAYGIGPYDVKGDVHPMEWKLGSSTPIDLTPGDPPGIATVLAVNGVGTPVGTPGAFINGHALSLVPRIVNLPGLTSLSANGISKCGPILVSANFNNKNGLNGNPAYDLLIPH